jgi:hypothetical protein
LIASEFAMKDDILAGKDLFRQADNASISADQQGLGGLLYNLPVVVNPSRLHLEVHGYAIALTHSFCAHGIFSMNFTRKFSVSRLFGVADGPSQEFVFPTNSSLKDGPGRVGGYFLAHLADDAILKWG